VAEIEVNAAPQQKVKFSLKNFRKKWHKDKEYILEVSLLQKESTAILPKGLEIAWDQFVLQKGSASKMDRNKVDDLTINTGAEVYTIQNKHTSLKINKATGEISSWAFGGKEITNQALKPNFWRPPTDNDLGNNMHKWARVWQEASYNYQAKLIGLPKKTNNKVTYKVGYTLPNIIAQVVILYTLETTGTLSVDYSFSSTQENLPKLPRLGMYLSLPKSYIDMSWYGRGPEESYWDRKTGQKIGLHSEKTADQFHRYSRPQETGNKTDVRWMIVSSQELSLKLTSNSLLNSSVWPFEMSEIDFNSGDASESASGLVPVTKKHGADIKIGETIQWNIDFLQMGVGGDTSWGRLVHPEYTILASKNYTYSFSIEPKYLVSL
jgi:beta-galactosidase